MHSSYTTTWKICNIRKKTKRSELYKAIQTQLKHNHFELSFKDNSRIAILITLEEKIPALVFKSQTLDLRKQKIEEKPVKDIVTPLNSLSYTDQLQKKAQKLTDFYTFLNCKEIETISSPIQTGYRNKCEFTFGFTKENKQILGFRPVKYSMAPNLIADPQECIYNTSPEMLSLVKHINQYLEKIEGLVFNRITKAGFLRLLCLRRIGSDLISILQVNTSTFEEALSNARITELVSILPGDVFFSCTTGGFDGLPRTAELKQIKGEPKDYQEVLNGCTFKVCPLGFFQINLSVADLLTKAIQNSIQTDIILDICSGSGVLGICTAKGTGKKVIGMEISQESIEDAKRNAITNGVDAQYYSGSVEKTLPLVLAKKVASSASALVDPPRAGVSDKLINEIISHNNISEIFYISCSYSSVKSNIQNISKAYVLKKIYVLDMFPYTDNIECIFHFIRKPKELVCQLESLSRTGS